jgi:5-methylcytosine-specific restriction protein A
MAKPWDHGGKTRQQRGYGRLHELIRAHLMATVVLCEECTRKGRTTAGEIADHKTPLAKGGTGDLSNYQLLCRACAREKDARDRGRPIRKKPRFGSDGWPIEEA